MSSKSLDGVFDLSKANVFTVNKYYKWYLGIISNALLRDHKKQKIRSAGHTQIKSYLKNKKHICRHFTKENLEMIQNLNES